jgi:DNA-binding winged helix-turn-helix (wHTH) protein
MTNRSEPSRGYAFGPFRLELPAVVLYRGQSRVPAPPKALELLHLLLSADGEVVSREQLQSQLWPDVVVEEGNLSKAAFLLRQTLAMDPAWAAAVETVPKRGYRWGGSVKPLEASPAQRRVEREVRTLAVLPYSGALPADHHLAEGIAERVLNLLVRAPGLSVLARASSFRFGMGAHDLAQIGGALGVDLLVDGRLERTAAGFRVITSLHDVVRDTTLWSAGFERRPAEVLLLDEIVARALCEALGLALPSISVIASPAQSLEKVVQARYFWNRRPGEVVNRAIQCYEEALALDPNNAEAWAGLAEVYVTLGSWEAGVLPHAEGQSKGIAHASRALALDPTFPDAHAALGYAALHFGWDAPAAEASLTAALRHGPQCVTAHHWYSHCLAAQGRVEESLEASRRCLQLDPMNLLMSAHLAWHYFMARQPADVVEAAERVLAMDPNYHVGQYFLSWGLEALGERSRALEAAIAGERFSQESLMMVSLVGRARAVIGDRDEAMRLVSHLQKAGGVSENFAYEIALVHLGLDEAETALDWLERARLRRSGWLAYLGVDPRLDPLRATERFQALEASVGFKVPPRFQGSTPLTGSQRGVAPPPPRAGR